MFPLVKLSIILSLVNAGTVLENVKTQLPGDRKQVEFLAASVCNVLVFILENKTSQPACQENFWRPVIDSTYQTEVSVRCRSERTLQIQVTPSNSWQLVVLIPETPEENHTINYRIIQPKTNSTDISVPTPSRDYVIYSTVLNKDGRPSLWHRQAKVPALSEHRKYDVQIQFGNYSYNSTKIYGMVTWNNTGDSDLCFEINNYCSKGGNAAKKIWPGDERWVKIDKLHLDDQCEVRVKGMYGTTKLKYSTPERDSPENDDCEAQDSSKLEVPRVTLLKAIEDSDTWKVRVGWAEPRHPPERYNVTLGAEEYTTLVVPGNATEAIFMNVKGEGIFNASILALRGLCKAQKFARAMFPDRREAEWRWAGAWGAAALGLLAAALCWLRLRTRIFDNKKPQKSTAEHRPPIKSATTNGLEPFPFSELQ